MSFSNAPYILNFKKIKVNNLTIRTVIIDEMRRLGKDCSLNHIDVSEVTSFNHLFAYRKMDVWPDISEWDTHNVEYMACMFFQSNFDGDISCWDVRNVKTTEGMFAYNSEFNIDLSGWKLESIYSVKEMFWKTKYMQDISAWAPYLVNASICNIFNKTPNPYRKKFYKCIRTLSNAQK